MVFHLFKYVIDEINHGHRICESKSTNLPRIDTLMVGKFFALNSDFCPTELRNVKDLRTEH